MTDPQNAPTAGQTAGLPGANAAPGTNELTDDERDETVSAADVADPGAEARAAAERDQE